MKLGIWVFALMAAQSLAHASPWTYRGTLNDGGKPANGRYDLRLTLLNESGTQAIIQPISLFDVTVKDGGFSVNVDFGIEFPHAAAMKLKTEVQQGGSGFVSLGEPTSFDPKAALAGVCWDTEGNAATDSAINFIGTTDAQPLIFRAENQPIIRLANVPITIGSTANFNAGSPANVIDPNVRGATINGGGMPPGDSDPDFVDEAPNQISGSYGTIGGGYGNTAGDGSGTTVGAAYATVAGGHGNAATGAGSTVGGGRQHLASGSFATVSGGNRNASNSIYAVVAGGVNNTANTSGSMVSGGEDNCAGGASSWAGGSRAKIRLPMGAGSNPPGQGCDSVVNTTDSNGDEGTFVWSDNTPGTFQSSGPNQFLVRADGGIGFNASLFAGSINDDMVIATRGTSGNANVDVRLTSRSGEIGVLGVSDSTGSTFLTTAPNTGENRLSVTALGVIGSIASLSNGGTWTNASSRSYKENFSTVDAGDVLRRLIALPIMTWDYRGSSEGLHMGPVAEDFKASFGLAGDGKSISTVDADGIALAAIQGLNQKLETENAALRARLEALEQLMAIRAAPSR